MVKEGKKISGPESLRDAAQGSARIRGDTLGIVGLGKCWPRQLSHRPCNHLAENGMGYKLTYNVRTILNII